MGLLKDVSFVALVAWIAPAALSADWRLAADFRAVSSDGRATFLDDGQGKLRFDGTGNFGDDLMRIKQVQNGKWVVVWPKEMTAGGAKLLAN